MNIRHTRRAMTIVLAIALPLSVAMPTSSLAAPLPAPMAAYSLDEGAGTTLRDDSGNGHDGQVVNGPSWDGGRFGNALLFDGTDDHVVLPNLDVGGSAITIMAWVKNPSFPHWVDQRFLSKATDGTESGHYWMLGHINSGGNQRLRFRLKTAGATSTLVASSGELPVGEWYHAAATYNGSTMRLYLDGVEVGATTKTGSITTNPAVPANIGRSPDGSNHTRGHLDEVRLFAQALTPAEVRTAMTTPVGEPLPPDTQPPTVTLTAPTVDTIVSGDVPLAAEANDDVGVAGVRFQVDGSNVGTEDFTAPFQATWDSATAPNGMHTITAIARDAAGNTATSTPVTVTTANTDLRDFVNEVVLTELDFVSSMEFLPDGKKILGAINGTVWVAQPSATTIDSTPFLSIPDVDVGGDEGLLDVALDPHFVDNGYIYAFYAHVSDRDRISRFTAAPGWSSASPDSEVVIWQGDVNSSTLHHGASIAFGPDGKLYFGTGDGGNASSSQSLSSLNGKILRIDPDGSIPDDNPFHDGAGPNRDAIWAYGLRNPFRMSFDSVSGKLYIGDVGGNDNFTAYEEVNVGVAGANYGWPLCEGACATAGITNPIHSYPHDGRDASITGGLVYRGSQFPSEFYGSYFLGDYSQNWIRRLSFNGDDTVARSHFFEPLDGGVDDPAIGDVVELKEGPDGAIYYLDLNFDDSAKTFNQGTLRRIRYIGDDDHPPIVVASADPLSGSPPLTVDFSSEGSHDPEGRPLTYVWDFGDGTTSTAANPTHVYASSGSYSATLTASDGVSTSFDSVAISVGNVPHGTISGPADGSTFRAGDVIAINGAATDAEDGELPDSAFSWSVIFHHEGHVHPVKTATDTKSLAFTVPTTGHDFNGNTRYEVILTVADSDGLHHRSSVVMLPEKMTMIFDTRPSGLTLELDGIAKTTPFTHDSLIGFNHDVQAPDQAGDGVAYAFESWNDGGGQQRTIVVPAHAMSYIANFSEAAVTDLEGYWALDDGQGAEASDGSGRGRHGALDGPVWTPNGRIGGALSFDGRDDHVDLGGIDIGGSAITMAGWVRFNALPTDVDQRFVAKATDASEAGHYWMFGHTYTGSAHRLRFRLKTGGVTSTLVASSDNLSPGVWYHAAAVYDGSAMKLYLDGREVGSRSKTGAIDTGNDVAVNMGRNPGGAGNHFNGTLDDVRLFSRALTPQEIQTVMEGG